MIVFITCIVTLSIWATTILQSTCNSNVNNALVTRWQHDQQCYSCHLFTCWSPGGSMLKRERYFI